MILERDIWDAALLMIRRYGSAARAQAAERGDRSLAGGDTEGCAVWKSIGAAIEWLQAESRDNELMN